MPLAASRGTPPLTAGRRWARRAAAASLVIAGVALIALAQEWRGLEATLSGHSIQFVTGETTIAVPANHLLILYENTSVQSVFVLTSECSVAYLIAALLIGAAPLMLLRQLSAWRTAAAVAATVVILTIVNVARLTAIGATVSAWGRDPGLAIAHTYLGSLLTVVGACAAGVAFVVVLVHRRNNAPTRLAG